MSGLVDGGMGWGEEGGDSIVMLIMIFYYSWLFSKYAGSIIRLLTC